MTSSTEVNRSAISVVLAGTGSLDDLAVAPQHVLVGGELPKAHRAAGMELLGRDADLGAEPEALAVGEPRRRVHDDDRGVDVAGEAAGGVEIAGDDRLGVARPEAVDVRNRVFEGSSDGDGHLQRQELAPEVVVRRALHAGYQGAGALIAEQLD